MLVLTRRLGEEIVIDGQIRIEVVGLKNGQVRLGITAPPLVSVLRSELSEPQQQAEEEKKVPVKAQVKRQSRRLLAASR